MSLDISLYLENTEHELHWQNITHNLGKMASEAGIYDCLWRAPENGFIKASQLIEPLAAGIEKMKASPEHYEQFDASNGWGTYEGFLPWLERLLEACKEYPDGVIETSR